MLFFERVLVVDEERAQFQALNVQAYLQKGTAYSMLMDTDAPAVAHP